MNASNNLLGRLGILAAFGGFACAALAFTFILNDRTKLPVKWAAGNVPLKIMLGDTANLIDGNSFNTSARAAANAWNAVLGSVQFTTTLTTGTPGDNNDVNELAFGSDVYGKAFEGDTVAVTTGWSRGNQRTEADIIFNNARAWDSYRGVTRTRNGQSLLDLHRVALHELGHVLGLDHPDQASPAQSVTAIMNSRVSNVDALAADDISGGQSLYGPPGVPANNNFADAATISASSGYPITVKGVNTNATKEAGEPNHDGNIGGRSVWWRWTAPSSGAVTVDTKGSYYDTTLAVYTGSAVSLLTSIGSDDDIEDGVVQASTVTFNAVGNTTYRIAVDGFNNNDGDGADSGGITLTLAFASSGGIPPTITSQPADVTVAPGGTASFSVTATGTDPLTYQWYFGPTAIAGATGATYTISNVTAANAGNYSVKVTNTAGVATSVMASLTVTSTPPPPPPPPSGGGGGGGGGGAPSPWFCAVLGLLALGRLLQRRR